MCFCIFIRFSRKFWSKIWPVLNVILAVVDLLDLVVCSWWLWLLGRRRIGYAGTPSSCFAISACTRFNLYLIYSILSFQFYHITLFLFCSLSFVPFFVLVTIIYSLLTICHFDTICSDYFLFYYFFISSQM